MGLTKKQRAERAAAKEKAEADRRLEELRTAFRWTEEEVAPDVLPPEQYDHTRRPGYNLLGDWMYPWIDRWWTEQFRSGPAYRDHPSRDGLPLYSSISRALRAARVNAERQAARVLLDIDRRIAEQEAKEIK